MQLRQSLQWIGQHSGHGQYDCNGFEDSQPCSQDWYRKHTLATGWFHPSYFDGMWSPSTHWRTSIHQGVLRLLALSFAAAATSTRSQSSNHLTHLLEIRALIQSIILPARCSSSSRHPSSISAKSEKRKAKEARGTGVNDVVLVVTRKLHVRT